MAAERHYYTCYRIQQIIPADGWWVVHAVDDLRLLLRERVVAFALIKHWQSTDIGSNQPLTEEERESINYDTVPQVIDGTTVRTLCEPFGCDASDCEPFGCDASDWIGLIHTDEWADPEVRASMEARARRYLQKDAEQAEKRRKRRNDLLP